MTAQPGIEKQYESATERLLHEFDAVFSREEVSEALRRARAEREANAKIKDFVPVLAERQAKDRLKALAQQRGAANTRIPVVIFVSPHNAGATQMAATLTDKYSGGRIHVMSAGIDPHEEIDPAVVQVMQERGIDTTHMYPQPVEQDVLRAADVVVTMADPDLGEDFLARRREDWPVRLIGQEVDAVRAARDEIKARVDGLIVSLLGEGSVLSDEDAAAYVRDKA
ncbi:Protein-tyrosine-phosphatase [Kytococcus aerolatus]|uniref:Protein-tyrosine-phosphatase n=1 Tax=Kytococcus aerolatus TaxID=592308 RepID=A0A212THN0_9MICO|nr:phosphatase [Kytococcus aerolatus]SNC65493.1 Protein-tyrosine-phosphatase [Kytococcus aerolatus]